MKIEKRTVKFNLEKREDEGKPPRLIGHAAVFDEPTPIMDFHEVVSRGAFRESIKQDDIRALFNHDPNHVLGRNTAETLRLKEDDKGLFIEIDPPDTQFARDLMVSMDRGDISQMSFGFQVLKDEWTREEGKPDLRTLKKVRLFDVSPVTFPAYDGTDIAVRSHAAWIKSLTNVAKRKRLSLNLRRKK